MLHDIQLDQFSSNHPRQAYLRPDLMRQEYVNLLRLRDAQRRAGHWWSIRQGIVQFSERCAARIGTTLLHWVEVRKLQRAANHNLAESNS
ncbi:hypothetical protein O2N63_02195 [Aliiroseovarius sp. KMU-50]|uniref:Uncharacterized protein n=1 Tax=Aliiroseovarius salicola TaxID=3009082 RepID=A0ABT4VXE0_9RHOB|nr:hypothetical protein [Aliiroseovarius sp. KMU-50]MDA5092886.1 hypothetical protein [Aliiroseovarius sp. KMU-50]